MKLDEHFDWHWALVYELVPRARPDIAVGQKHLTFFNAIGLALEQYKPDNWHGCRLVDYNDISSPFSKGWQRTAVRHRKAETWFSTLEPVQDSVISRRIYPETCSARTAEMRLFRTNGEEEVKVWPFHEGTLIPGNRSA